MKKTYQMPTIKRMEAEAEEMMTASGVENGFTIDESMPTTDATQGNLSRKSVWDDEEE